MNILVTGSRGFLGRNLVSHLAPGEDHSVTGYDLGDGPGVLRAALTTAEVVYHLAGVNRPKDALELEAVNVGLTRQMCSMLQELGRAPLIVFSSSVQAELENPYGASKRRAEVALREFEDQSGARVRIYRLKNVFGKWCRPNYNSVVATFCHNIAHDLPIHISDQRRELDLVYIDDVVSAFLSELPIENASADLCEIPSFKLRLGDLAGRVQAFHEMRASLCAPDFSDRFNQQLYATYLSYVPDDARRQQLQMMSDHRGGLAEFIKSKAFGQIFISRTKPGVTRGNHYHHTKTEKFFVVEGEGVVRMRQIEGAEVVEYRVRGDAFRVIDIPPGYTHSIENVGRTDMVTIFWASEIFNPDRPDTYYLPVLAPAEIPVTLTI